MVSKTPWAQGSTNAKNDKSSLITDNKVGLNRRQFLRQIGITAGTGLLATQTIAQVLTTDTINGTDNNGSTSLTKDDLPMSLTEESRAITDALSTNKLYYTDH